MTDLQVKTNQLPLNEKYNRINIRCFHVLRFSGQAHRTPRSDWHCASNTEEEDPGRPGPLTNPTKQSLFLQKKNILQAWIHCFG